MNLKFLSVLLAFPILWSNVSAQQEPQFSQNMFNILTVNPGYAGTNNSICANILYRNQWTGFTGAPKTSLFNIESPVKFLKGGVGLTLFNDKLGLDETVGAKLSYAFHMHIGPGQLGIGLQAGYILKKLLGSRFNAFVNDGSDESIPTTDIAAGSPTFGFGLFYKTDIYYIGLSSTQLAESSVGYSKADYNLKRHYYLTGGFSKRLTSNIELLPSVFFKFDPPVAPQIDLNIMAMYNNQFWGTISYRLTDTDALVPMIGVLWNNVKIGYSYDITLQELRGFSSGTHEILIGYCFKMDEKVSAQKYRNVRFL